MISFGIVPAEAMDFGDGNKMTSKLPLFTGQKSQFVIWLAKFIAVATWGKFYAAITQHADGSIGEANCPVDQAAADALGDTDVDKKAKAAWERNNRAVAALTLCLPDKLYRLYAGAVLASEIMKELF